MLLFFFFFFPNSLAVLFFSSSFTHFALEQLWSYEEGWSRGIVGQKPAGGKRGQSWQMSVRTSEKWRPLCVLAHTQPFWGCGHRYSWDMKWPELMKVNFSHLVEWELTTETKLTCRNEVTAWKTAVCGLRLKFTKYSAFKLLSIMCILTLKILWRRQINYGCFLESSDFSNVCEIQWQ